MAKQVVVYGASWCQTCARLKSFLDEHRIEYTYKDVDSPRIGDEHHSLEGLDIPDGRRGIPTIVIDGEAKIYPEDSWLYEKLGLTSDVDASNVRDLIIVGAGPTALAAAVYTTREDINTLIFEKGVIGGLAAITDWVDNYPGFVEGIAGIDLAEHLQKQAERFGTVIEFGEVLSIKDEGQYKRLETTSGDMLAKSVLIATGSSYKKLGIPGEEEFYGKGVHSCATCDGAFYRDKKIVVVGGGNSAVQEAMYLTKFASHIDMLVRGESFRASEVLQHEIEEKYKDKITVHFNTTTDEIVGKDGVVSAVVGTDKTSGDKVTFEVDGIFVFIGLIPNVSFLEGSGIELDDAGFVKTNEKLETSVPGIFCAGDVRSGATMQIASAVGEGASAALQIREYLKEHQNKHS